MSQFSEPTISRREYLLATTTTVVGVGGAGCIEGEEDGDNDNETPVSADGFSAQDIEVGDDDQRVTVTLSNVDPGDEVDVYIDATSLTAANVNVADISLIADVTRASSGWEVTDAELTVEEDVLIRVTATVGTDAERGDGRGSIRIDLTGLDTSDAEHSTDLEHHLALSPPEQEEAPSFTNSQTATYDVIDPDELENILDIAPDDIRAGDTEQRLAGRILHPTSVFVLAIDITPLREAGIGIDDADIIVDAPQDADDFAITDVSIEAGVVRLRFEVSSGTAGFDCRITNLDTEELEPTDGITYPIFTGERPSDPQRSSSFDVSGVTA